MDDEQIAARRAEIPVHCAAVSRSRGSVVVDRTPDIEHDDRPEYFRVLAENAGLREENAALRVEQAVTEQMIRERNEALAEVKRLRTIMREHGVDDGYA